MKAWLVMVWDVPDRLGGMAARLGLRQSSKNPKNWWIKFDPANAGAKPLAEKVRAELLAAGLSGSWRQVEDDAPKMRRPYHKRHTPASTYTPIIQGNDAGRWKHEQERLAREHRKQAEQMAEREMNDHVRQVLRRAKGEM